MDFLPEDLAENLIPYEPDPMQTGVLPELPPEVQIQSGVMPELTPEVQYQTGVLPELPPEAQYQTGVLPELPPEVQYQTGVLPELPPEVQIQSGVLPELPPEIQYQTGVIPELPPEVQYQTGVIPELPPEVQSQTEVISQTANEQRVRKKKRSKDDIRQTTDAKKQKVHKKSSEPEVKEETPIVSSYVEKKSSPLKDRFKYTVIVVPENRKGHFRPVFLGYTLVNVILGFFALLLVILAINNIAKGFKIRSLTAENEKMQSTIDTMETNMVYLTSANAGLSDKVAVLSETVNQKTGELENYVKDEESKMTPKGFPFAGQAALLESTETAENAKVALGGESESEKNKKRKPGFDLEGYPIAIFSASKGTNVIATANGKVKEVADDLCFGKRVTVEHSNGMVTIYRCSASPKVNVKQDVKQGDTLYELGSDNIKLGYQIIKGNDYIDPLEMLDIAG